MNNNLLQFEKLVPFLGKIMGIPFEVILFDVTKHNLPIIVSDNIKDSTVEKAREFVRNVMNVKDIETRDYWVNHAQAISNNKLSKMSVFFIRDEENVINAALVICMRCDEFFKMESFLNSMLHFCNVDQEGELNNLPYEPEMQADWNPSLEKITEYIQEFGVDPERTNHDEKSEIICDLYDMGVFNLKGAVAKTAEELGISTKSVYRYISNIKKARE